MLATIAVLAAMTSWPAQAVTDEEIFRDFRFNSLNPGARAMSLGGAFISLADDSTAAQANPAGLVNLRAPELFFEVRSSRIDTSGASLNVPVRTKFFDGKIRAESRSEPESRFDPTFVSYVVPAGRVAFGFSRLEALDYQASTRNSVRVAGTRAIIGFDAVTGRPEIIGFAPVNEERFAEADVDARLEQYNFAFAVDAHRRFAIGATAVIGRYRIDGRVDNLVRDRTALPGDPLATPTLDYATRVNGEDTDVTWTAGILWRPVDPVRVGAVYRRGSRFVVEERIERDGVEAKQARKIFGTSFENVMRTPDSYGGGVSFRPVDALTFFVDVVRVRYSDLLDGYTAGLNAITFPSRTSGFTIDDAREYHGGAEYHVLVGETPLAVRAGVWTDPDNRIRWSDEKDSGLTDVFPGRDELKHYTAGIGVTLKESIQLDFAGDVSSETTTFVASTIIRF